MSMVHAPRGAGFRFFAILCSIRICGTEFHRQAFRLLIFPERNFPPKTLYVCFVLCYTSFLGIRSGGNQARAEFRSMQPGTDTKAKGKSGKCQRQVARGRF